MSSPANPAADHALTELIGRVEAFEIDPGSKTLDLTGRLARETGYKDFQRITDQVGASSTTNDGGCGSGCGGGCGGGGCGGCGGCGG